MASLKDATVIIDVGVGPSYANVHIAPQEMTMAIQDVDYESGRNANGEMVRTLVATKRKYSIVMPPCDTATIKPVLKAINHKAFFKCTFPDPLEDSGLYTGTFYVGDRNLPIYNYDMDIWNRVTFDFVEK